MSEDKDKLARKSRTGPPRGKFPSGFTSLLGSSKQSIFEHATMGREGDGPDPLDGAVEVELPLDFTPLSSRASRTDAARVRREVVVGVYGKRWKQGFERRIPSPIRTGALAALLSGAVPLILLIIVAVTGGELRSTVLFSTTASVSATFFLLAFAVTWVNWSRGWSRRAQVAAFADRNKLQVRFEVGRDQLPSVLEGLPARHAADEVFVDVFGASVSGLALLFGTRVDRCSVAGEARVSQTAWVAVDLRNEYAMSEIDASATRLLNAEITRDGSWFALFKNSTAEDGGSLEELLSAASDLIDT